MEIIGPDFRALMITKHQSYYIHTVLLGVVFFLFFLPLSVDYLEIHHQHISQLTDISKFNN